MPKVVDVGCLSGGKIENVGVEWVLCAFCVRFGCCWSTVGQKSLRRKKNRRFKKPKVGIKGESAVLCELITVLR